jgi:PAS domain-containing protein
MFNEDLDEHWARMRLRQQGQRDVYEWRFRRADGSECWCRVSATALLDAGGQFIGSFGVFTDITERKRTEEQMRRTTDLLDAIREVQSRYIANEKSESVFKALLGVLTRTTGSPIGFLDEVRRDPGGEIYKVSLALSDISWDDPSRRLYADLVSQNRAFRNLRNLAGFPALHGIPIIANDARHDSRAGGLPPGHPEIRAFMGLPLFYGGDLVGVAGVANRLGGYSLDMAASLEPLLSACAGIIHALRADRRDRAQQDALRQQTDEARFLANASITLATFATVDEVFAFIRASVPVLLPGVVTVTGRASEDATRLEVIDIQGLEQSRLAAAIQALGFDPRGRRFALIDRFREICARARLHRHEERLADLAASALPQAVSKAIERLLGLQAIYTIGIADEGRIHGHLHVFVMEGGGEVNASFVESFVHLCSLALSRITSREALRQSEENFRRFAEAVNEVFWLRDADLGRAPAGVTGHHHDTRHALGDDVETAFVAVRTGLAETRNRAIDQSGINRGQCFIRKPEAGHDARTEIFHNDVCGFCQPLKNQLCVRMLQVQCEGFLVCILREKTGPHQILVEFGDISQLARQIAGIGRLNL